jgi:predicted DNA-binding transcriptional regulator YafY
MPPTTTETQLRNALMIRDLLISRPMGVQELAERIQIGPRSVQRILAVMSRVWVVVVERRGRNLVYRMDEAPQIAPRRR